MTAPDAREKLTDAQDRLLDLLFRCAEARETNDRRLVSTLERQIEDAETQIEAARALRDELSPVQRPKAQRETA